MSATVQRKRSIFDDSDDEEDELSSDTPDSKTKVPKKNASGLPYKKAQMKVVSGKKEMKTSIDDKRGMDSAKTQEVPTTPEKDDAAKEQSKKKIVLSPAQRALIEQKRQQALLIKQEKMNRRNPYMRQE